MERRSHDGDELEIRMLGSFAVRIGGRVLPSAAWEHRRAADLVKLLALAPDHRLVRDQVLDTLWPRLAPDAGGAALHKAASLARRALGSKSGIVLRLGEVALAPDGAISTDVKEFEQACRRALASGEPDVCARAASLYGGELLPADRYADWAEAPRARLAARHLELLRKAGAWEELVVHDPLDERAHVALMRLYAGAGRRAAALRQFRRMRDVLADQLGVAPAREAVALYEEIARGPAVVAPLSDAPALIGRQVELARMRAALRKAAAGHGHTLLVHGEAGIGKTRLCEALLDEASHDGAATLRGGASIVAPGAYAPVVESLDRLLLARPEIAARLTEPARRVLARLSTTIPAPITDQAGTGAIGRQPIFSAIAQLLAITAKERPLLIFLDDLHAADDSTLQLVHYIAELARSQPILVLAAFRSEGHPTLARTRAALLGQRAATDLALGALTRGECEALVAQTTGARTAPAAITSVYERTAGNPLFTKLLAAAPAAEAASAPEDVYLVIEGLLARAGADVTHLLERVAVLGDKVPAEELLAVADAPEEETFGLLDAALRHRLLDEHPGGYRFHHGLLREALLRRMPAHRRTAAHLHAAQHLAMLGAPARRIALLLLEGGASAQAVPWLTQAAHEEARVSAFQSAVRFVDLALEHAEPSTDLLALRADLLFVTGDPGGPSAYELALASAAEHERPALHVRKARAELAGGDLASAIASFVGAGDPPAEDDLARTRYFIVRGQLAWMQGDLEAAEEAVTRAKALALGAVGSPEVAEAVVTRGMVAHSRGAWLEDARTDLLGVERSAALATAIHEGHLCVAEIYLYGGQPYEDVSRFARELLEAGERSGARRAVTFATCLLGEIELLTGELDAAAPRLEAAAELALETGSKGAAALALQRCAEVALHRGDLARAGRLLEDALALARATPLGQRHLLQRVYGTRVRVAGEGPDALAVVDEAEVAIAGPSEGCVACAITLAVPAAIACARGGQVERGQRYLELAARTARMFWRTGGWYAAVAEARAAICLAQGEPDEGLAELRRAEALFAEAGQRLDAARCREAAAAVESGLVP